MRASYIGHEQRNVRARSAPALDCGASCESFDSRRGFSRTTTLTPDLPICDQPRRAVSPIPASPYPKDAGK